MPSSLLQQYNMLYLSVDVGLCSFLFVKAMLYLLSLCLLHADAE